MFNDMSKAGVKVMPCPFCLQMSTKDEGCNHVTCYFCKNDYCFACSAKRSPTLTHGNHYHRPSCPHFFTYNGEDKFLPLKCSECKRLGKLCMRPHDLVDGDIPPDERPDI